MEEKARSPDFAALAGERERFEATVFIFLRAGTFSETQAAGKKTRGYERLWAGATRQFIRTELLAGLEQE